MVQGKMQVNILTDYWNKEEKEELIRATKFYGEILIHPRTLKNVIIDIERNPNLIDEAECINEDDTKRSRYFTIVLRCADGDDAPIRTLAHEMVHVKQFIKNELNSCLVFKGDKMKLSTIWKGEVWEPKGKEHPYFDCPSEIEAFGREVGLFTRWLDYKDSI